ncbi:Cof-type HAD-IIB family hydrolase [Aquibacillus rhizosphaerae]|uniref:Cof-type HAD-IIB family hydrolase n=1 Tax=Aquibacillus rhizosphaerae TaxID=3051431 RepID=A0ABT7L8L8_9BACI|nr:Cof-type HAD-IIB family hydrolase [Aquibacillus sp. LR5S19]MDL4842213.1 Cof-type HAD-IIB family hydrolase [Aquibacillus sp. LR5S19]
MSKCIIFFDIDGTLLTHEKELPKETKQAIFKLKQLGHDVAIATGRAPFMYEDLRKELEIDSFVSYNGSYVVYKDEVIFTNPLNVLELKKLTEEALINDHPVVFMDHEDMKANVPDHVYINESFQSLQINQFPSHDPNYHQGRELYQTLLFCKEREEKYYQEKYKSFDFVRWHPFSLDIVPRGGSKAIGIAKLAAKLGYAKDRQYAFGDGLNDLEMLSVIENSVAMGNAVDDVKSVAKYVTKSVEDNGILHGLKMVGLL